MNILYLIGSFFMLEVYDRVIPSRFVPALIKLSALALALYAGDSFSSGSLIPGFWTVLMPVRQGFAN